MSEAKQKLVRRLKIIEGQVRGLQDMLSRDTYCIDVITQTSAVKNALSGVEGHSFSLVNCRSPIVKFLHLNNKPLFSFSLNCLFSLF